MGACTLLGCARYGQGSRARANQVWRNFGVSVLMTVPSSDYVQKHAKTALLRVIEAVIERLGRFRDLFQFGCARSQVFGAVLYGFDDITMLTPPVGGVFAPFSCASSSGVCCVTKGGFERWPIFFLSRR